MEQEPLLGDDHDALAQRPERGVAQVDAAVRDHAVARVVEPGDELGQRGLPRAGRADQGDALTGGDLEVDVVQHELAARPVAERHVRDRQRAVDGQVDRARTLGDRRRRVEQTEELVQRGAGRLHGVVDLAELLHGLEQVVQVQDERGDGPHRHDVHRREPPTDAHDRGDADHPEVLDEREVAHGDARRLDVGVVLGFVGLVEPSGEEALLPERLHHPHPGQPLLERREVVPDPLAHLEVREVGPAPEPPGPDDQRGQQHEDAQRELPAQEEDRHERAAEQQDVLHERGEAHLDELLHRVDVGRHARDEAPGLLPVEEVETERRDVAEHPHAQVAQERLADAGHHHDRDTPEEEREQSDPDVHQGRLVQDRDVVGLDALVDAPPHEEGAAEEAQGLHAQHRDRQHDRAAVGPQHPPQAAQHLLGLVAVEALLLTCVIAPAAAASHRCGAFTVRAPRPLRPLSTVLCARTSR